MKRCECKDRVASPACAVRLLLYVSAPRLLRDRKQKLVFWPRASTFGTKSFFPPYAQLLWCELCRRKKYSALAHLAVCARPHVLRSRSAFTYARKLIYLGQLTHATAQALTEGFRPDHFLGGRAQGVGPPLLFRGGGVGLGWGDCGAEVAGLAGAPSTISRPERRVAPAVAGRMV